MAAVTCCAFGRTSFHQLNPCCFTPGHHIIGNALYKPNAPRIVELKYLFKATTICMQCTTSFILTIRRKSGHLFVKQKNTAEFLVGGSPLAVGWVLI